LLNTIDSTLQLFLWTSTTNNSYTYTHKTRQVYLALLLLAWSISCCLLYVNKHITW